MAGGDAGEVAESRRSELQVGLPRGVVEDLVNEGEGKQVRHVGDGGEHGVVFRRAHTVCFGTDGLPQGFQPAKAV